MDIKRTYAVKNALTPQKVCQLLLDGTVNDLPFVGLDAELPVGAKFISSTTIDKYRILITYVNTTDNYLYAVVCSLSSTGLVFGTPVQINSTATLSTCCCTLDSTKCLIGYGTSANAFSIVVTISGNVISIGSPVTITSSSANNYMSILTLSSSTALILYQGASIYMYGVILSVSGTVITVNTPLQITSSASYNMCCAYFDITHIYVAYKNVNSYTYGVLLTLSGTTISAGSLVQISTATVTYLSITKINDTCLVLASGYSTTTNLYAIYKYGAGAGAYPVNGLGVSGITHTSGQVLKIDENNIALFCKCTSPDYFIHVKSYSFADTFYPYYYYSFAVNSVTSSYLCCNIINGSMVMIYQNGTTGNYLHVTILDICDGYNTYISKCGKVLGIAQDSNGTVLLKGVSKGHVGLLVGEKYYFDLNGNISTDNSGVFVGIAVSDTQLLVPDYIIN